MYIVLNVFIYFQKIKRILHSFILFLMFLISIDLQINIPKNHILE